MSAINSWCGKWFENTD